VALDADYVLTSDIDASETSTWHGGDGFRSIGASVGGTVTGGRDVGGLIGDNDGDVSDATSSADVTGDGLTV